MRKPVALLVVVALAAAAAVAVAEEPRGRRFRKADDYAKAWDDPARDAWQKPAEVVKLLALAEGMTVADIGAGTGYFEPHLARAVGPRGRVLALDIEPDMVRYLRDRARREKLAGVTPVLVVPDDPKLEPAGVDRVLIVNTWHHISAREAYARKLAAGLKPGGTVLVVDFTMDSEHGPPRGERLPPEQVMKELQAAGLEASVKEETLPDQYIVAGTLLAAH